MAQDEIRLKLRGPRNEKRGMNLPVKEKKDTASSLLPVFPHKHWTV